MSTYQWYPGHIAKLEKALLKHLSPAEVIVEVLDARIPRASRNPRLDAQLAKLGRPRVLLLNKADLADPAQTQRWCDLLSTPETLALPFEAKSGKANAALLKAIQRQSKPLLARWAAKGLKPRSVRVVIVGMPNVGKSSIINRLVGKARTKTGHMAGVTRQPQWVRIHDLVDLLDTPGLIPPKLGAEHDGALLAAVSSIGEAAFDDEPVARALLACVQQRYPGRLEGLYGVPYEPADGYLDRLGHRLGHLGPGAQPDPQRTAQAVLRDFRQGRWGPLTLEVPDAESPPEPPEGGGAS